jgi:hypothetical protein
LDFFGGIRAFQWVTANPNKKIFPRSATFKRPPPITFLLLTRWIRAAPAHSRQPKCIVQFRYFRSQMRRAPSLWSRRRQTWQRPGSPKESRPRLTLPVCASERASVAGAQPVLTASLRSGNTGLSTGPPALRAYLIRDAADFLAPLSSEIQGAAGVAERSGDGDRGGGVRDNARCHFSRQCSCISCCFRADAVDFSQKMRTPTRFNNRDRIPKSRPLRARSPTSEADGRQCEQDHCPDSSVRLNLCSTEVGPQSTSVLRFGADHIFCDR